MPSDPHSLLPAQLPPLTSPWPGALWRGRAVFPVFQGRANRRPWVGALLVVLGLGQVAQAAAGPLVQIKLVPVCVTTLYQGCGLVDRGGNWTVRPWYTDIRENGGGWTVEKQSGLTGWLGADGTVVIEPRFEFIGQFAGGLAPARLHGKDAKYGYIGTSGRWVIPPKFTAATAFSEGLASVQWTEGARERSGYIDPRGRTVIPTLEWSDRPFVDGRTTVMRRVSEHAATVCTGIDRRGRELVRTTGKESCAVTVVPGGGWTVQSDDVTRLVDRNNRRTLFAVQGEEAYIHGDPEGSPVTGLGVFSTGQESGLLDLRTGRVLIAPRAGQHLGFHGEGRVSYRREKNGQTVYGFLDSSGRPVIPARYASSGQFQHGRVMVTLPPAPPSGEGRPVVLNLQGQELPGFKALRPTSIELAPWEGDVQTPVRRNAARVTTDQDEVVWTDLDGRPFLRVRASRRCAIDEAFNRKGQRIWPADSAGVCRVNDAGFAEYGALTPAQKALLDHKHAFERDRLNDQAYLRAQGKRTVFDWVASPEEQRAERLIREADWLDGPQDVSLSPGVRLSVPAGYRYLPAEALAALRRRLSDGAAPAPAGAVPVRTGWLLGPHEHWRTEISVVQRGHMDLTQPLPGADELLETMKVYTAGSLAGGTGAASFRHLAWLLPPRLDPVRPQLTYAYTDAPVDVSGRRDVLNVALFGRREVVALSTVWRSPLQAMHFELFQEDVLKLSGQIHFVPGHRYQDHQVGEAVAPVALETLMTGPPPQEITRIGEAIADMEQRRQARINGRLLALLVILGVVTLGFTARWWKPAPAAAVPADPSRSRPAGGAQAQRRTPRKQGRKRR
ncbi:WG repeat-containing protein (plasmid) [Deinococcus taeanensis]|uniref:WG repeat-containing protein n=1 Tax=Deinococcus taeanensis TaxID=2737050 RepID=UPI001CDCBE16|nr:WG repeat-containing protein [Deinococcus taeanensis]UBV44673.1 WG repeat-containing protein [Deinococcus taeanensis]